jgi:hypothetical protein
MAVFFRAPVQQQQQHTTTVAAWIIQTIDTVSTPRFFFAVGFSTKSRSLYSWTAHPR